MDSFIRRENIALFRKRLEDPRTSEAEREILLRLLAREEAKVCSSDEEKRRD